jgi:hypothetical protein
MMLELRLREAAQGQELEATQQNPDPLQRQAELLRVMGAVSARLERVQMAHFFLQG